MKKILAFFSAVAFLGSTTLAVSACGVSQGTKIDVVIKDAPEKAKETEDPLVDYVYNNKYNYSSANVNYLIGLAAQLVSDKIYNVKQTGTDWEEFYNYQIWQRESFTSFTYAPTLSGDEKAFSFRDSKGEEFVYQIRNNDASDDDNKLMAYWFIVSATQGGPPSRNNITIPRPSEFDHDTEIKTQTGWIHLALNIGVYQIDFNTEINFNFTRITDVNNQQVVLLDLTTFTKPFGDIDFSNPPYDKINNLTLSKPSTP